MSKENIYLIKLYNDQEQFYKIGTTVHRFCRFYQIMKAGYNADIIYMVLGVDFTEALNAENTLQQLFKPYTPLKKFGGHRECFSHIDVDQYKKYLHGLISNYSEITENLEISWR